MCGIFGIVSKKKKLSSNQKEKIFASLYNRGPDNQNYYSDKNNFEFLHTRLSIQDLSSKANQPMMSKNRRFMIIFNGEIFNHFSLRKKYFQNLNFFKTNSDTETLLEMIAKFGIDETLQSVKGQFAFGVCDFKHKKIFIAVDRLSEKPVYYTFTKDYLIFSSDINPIKHIDFVEKKISKIAITQLLKYNYIPHPYSIYDNIYKLEAGSYLEFKLGEREVELIYKKKYWNIENKFLEGHKTKETDKFFIEEFEKKLNNSVREQLISDIPIGCFLSGGLDSSLIAIIMSQNYVGKKMKTFSIGFDNSSFDETSYANEIAKFIGSEHHKKIFSKKDLVKKIQSINEIYAEPFGDSSALPTALVSEFAKNNGINVVLTGDGGDEFLGGYQRYLWTDKLSKRKINNNLIKLTQLILQRIGSKNINFVHQKLKKILPSYMDTPDVYSKIIKLIKILSTTNSTDAYSNLVSNDNYIKMLNFVEDDQNKNMKYYLENKDFDNLDFKEKMMLYDINNYLTGDILVKVDRACMQYSVESRSPFLDKDLLEFSCELPLSLKFSKNSGKIITKKILSKYCTNDFINRGKMGFGIPLGDFLRFDLKDWIFDIINSRKIIENEHVNINQFKRLYKNHCEGIDRKELVWSTIGYLSWLNSN